jgi:hypothetical protein
MNMNLSFVTSAIIFILASLALISSSLILMVRMICMDVPGSYLQEQEVTSQWKRAAMLHTIWRGALPVTKTQGFRICLDIGI